MTVQQVEHILEAISRWAPAFFAWCAVATVVWVTHKHMNFLDRHYARMRWLQTRAEKVFGKQKRV